MEATAEAGVLIEERRSGYVRYAGYGRRWEVYGICDHRGDCIVGAVIDGEFVSTLERAHELAVAYDGPDVPVGPGFEGCCPLRVVEL